MKKILYVENEINVTDIFKDALGDTNYQIIIAQSSKVAEKKMQENSFDIIILDLHLEKDSTARNFLTKVISDEDLVKTTELFIVTGSKNIEECIGVKNLQMIPKDNIYHKPLGFFDLLERFKREALYA